MFSRFSKVGNCMHGVVFGVVLGRCCKRKGEGKNQTERDKQTNSNLADEFLHDFAKGLEYGVIVDAGEIEADLNVVEPVDFQLLTDTLVNVSCSFDAVVVRQAVHLVNKHLKADLRVHLSCVAGGEGKKKGKGENQWLQNSTRNSKIETAKHRKQQQNRRNSKPTTQHNTTPRKQSNRERDLVSFIDGEMEATQSLHVFVLGVNDKDQRATIRKNHFGVKRRIEKIDLPRKVPDLKEITVSE